MSPRSIGGRRLGRVLVALALVPTFAVICAALVLGTAWGRLRLLEQLLARLNASIPGHVEVDRLDRLSPFGLTLTGLRLSDPASTRVLSLASVRIELAPLELLHGRIVLPSVAIGPGQADLRELDVPGRGIMGALVAKAAPAPDAASPPPYVRVDELTLVDISVDAPPLPPPGTNLRVRRLTASARLEVDGETELTVHALSADVLRAEQPLLRLTRATLHLARPGTASELTLDVELGAARLAGSARGVIAPSAALESSPLEAGWRLSGLRAGDLALLLDDPAFASAFAGSAELEGSMSGSLERLSLRSGLVTAAGALDLRAQLRGRRELDIGLGGQGLELSRLRPDLPALPLSFALDSSVDLSTPSRLPITVRVRAGQLGPYVLPELDGRGTWNGASLEDLVLELTRRSSLLRAEGSIAPAGAFELKVSAALRAEELADWVAAAGWPRAPRGLLGADLRVGRSLDGALALRGGVRARSIGLPGLSLDAATVEVDLTGAPWALRGDARASLRGLARGGWRVPRLALTLQAAPTGYRLRGSGAFQRLQATIDVWAQPDVESLVLRGHAHGDHAGTPFELMIEPTTLHRQGWLSTRGVELRAGGQALKLTGDYGRPRSELVLVAPALDLATLGELGGLGADWRGHGQLTLRLKGRPEVPVLDATLEARDLSRAGAAAVDARLSLSLDAAQGRAKLDGAVSSESSPRWIGATLALDSRFTGGPGWQQRLLGASHRAAIEIERLDVAGLEPWLGRPLPGSAQLALAAKLDGTLARPVVHAKLAATTRDAFGLVPLRIEQRLDYEAGALALQLDVDDAVGRWLSADAEVELGAHAAENLLVVAERWRELADSARWSLELDAARRRLGSVSTQVPASVADLELDGRLRLSHDAGAEPAGHASVRVTQADATPSPAGCTHAGVALALEAELSRGELAAAVTARHGGTELLRVSSRASVELGQALRGGAATLGAVSAELTSRALALERVPYLCQRLRGQLDARVRLLDVLGTEPSLSGDVTATGLSMGAEPRLDVKLLARADHDDADATLTISAPKGRSVLSARVPIRWSSGRFTMKADAPLTARAHLDALPIAPLLDPAGALSYATGTVSGKVEVAGTLSAPEPSGQLELRDGELTATALAQPLHGVRGRFAFNRSALWIEKLEARDRDGLLELSGKVERQGLEALTLALQMRAKDFPLRQRGQVVATTSGRAKIDASLGSGRSTVSIQLADADTWLEKVQIRSGIDLRAHPDVVIVGAPGTGGAAAPQISAASSAPASPAGATPTAVDAAGVSAEAARATESHIRLDATDHFWIKREDFAIQLSTRLDAVIIGDQAKIKGRVDIHRGYLDLMGRVFDVDRNSRLDFTGTSTPDPVVAISATYEHRGSGKTVKVQIGGRGSRPSLSFYVDDAEVSAGEALEVLVGRRSSGNEAWAKEDATSFVSGLTAGLLATSARRELGAAAPILMIEPGDQTGDGRIRAGFELDALVPRALRQLITGVYVEGIVEREGSGNERNTGQQSSTQAGVLVELYFPHQLFSTGQWGPGTTWSLDGGWQL